MILSWNAIKYFQYESPVKKTKKMVNRRISYNADNSVCDDITK